MATNMVEIMHRDYEKISDTLFILSGSWVIKFNVNLNKYSDYGRTNYHKEVAYIKTGYPAISVSRSFDYNITIGKFNSGEKDSSIMILSSEYYFFLQKLILGREWFISKDYDGLFVRKDTRIVLSKAINPQMFIGKCGKFELIPDVFEAGNGEHTIGVMFKMNDIHNIFVDVNKYLSLVHFMEIFNPFQSAQLMINYLQRPPYGTNMFSFIENTDNINEPPSTPIKPRSKKPKSNTGFFEKFDK